MAIEAQEKETPHYYGHRDRLRQRFLQAGPDALADYEMLELLLFMAIPRRDVKPLAKQLLLRFQNLAGVLNATVADLQTVEGISETTAIALKAVQASSHRLMRQEIMHRPVLSSWPQLLDYIGATMAHERKEHFRLLFLNKRNELIADEIQGSGTIDHTPVYTREIMKRALEIGATALILVHNHPSGDPSPSQADIEMTAEIIAAATPLGITIHDHLISSRKGIASFRAMGLI